MREAKTHQTMRSTHSTCCPPTGNYFECSAAISWILALGDKFADAGETFCARPPCTRATCAIARPAASSYSNITMARYLQFKKVSPLPFYFQSMSFKYTTTHSTNYKGQLIRDTFILF